MNDSSLPEPEKSNITLGYLRLNDSAPFIVARELGYFEQLGLNVTLSREVSWAAVRDKLASGLLDAAQMLSPLPAMTTLGLSGLRTPIMSSLVLSNNGNAISVSAALMARLKPSATHPDVWLPDTAIHTKPLTFAVVHGFSTHHLLLRRWFRMGGLNPDTAANVIVVPPSQMADSLASGLIDGYCAGEPWNTLAVLNGAGHIAAAGLSIWPDAPEKVLSTTTDWHEKHPKTHLLIRLALLKACKWLNAQNEQSAAEMISAETYLNLPLAAITPALTGRINLARANEPRSFQNFHQFNDDERAVPNPVSARELMIECSDLLGKALDEKLIQSVVTQTTRSDLGIESLDIYRQQRHYAP